MTEWTDTMTPDSLSRYINSSRPEYAEMIVMGIFITTF